MEAYCCIPYGGYNSQAGPYPNLLTVNMPRRVPVMLQVFSIKDKAKAWSIALLCAGRRAGTPSSIPVRFPRAAMSGT